MWNKEIKYNSLNTFSLSLGAVSVSLQTCNKISLQICSTMFTVQCSIIDKNKNAKKEIKRRTNVPRGQDVMSWGTEQKKHEKDAQSKRNADSNKI